METINRHQSIEKYETVANRSNYFKQLAERFYKETHKMYQLKFLVVENDRVRCLVEPSESNRFPCQFDVKLLNANKIECRVATPRLGGYLNKRQLADVCSSVVASYIVVEFFEKVNVAKLPVVGWYD